MSKKVAVALSGGVDSSVAALLLKEQGYDVVGIYMKNWDDEECPHQLDYQDVIAVADKIGIPFYTFDFTHEYWDGVFQQFLDELKLGMTPNPDILCNREIKFKVLLDKAMGLGVDALATGHYARTRDGRLLRGIDRNKDQSYFLYTLKKELLDRILFPVGEMEKSQVRKLAEENGLRTHDKKDSTGICFIGKRRFSDFMANYLKPKPGHFVDEDGRILGEHNGAYFYTIGQRKGLGVGGPGEAWYVAHKEMEKNEVLLVQGENHPALLGRTLTANEVSWVDPSASQTPMHCTAKIRYRSPDAPCYLTQIDDQRLKVVFDRPERAITSRQSIVFYDEDVCLGGAMIEGKLIEPS